MKIKAIVLGLCLAIFASSSFACPKGQHLVGGKGPHHKGGHCVKK